MNKIVIFSVFLYISSSIFSLTISVPDDLNTNFTQHNGFKDYDFIALSINWEGHGSLNNLFDAGLEKKITDNSEVTGVNVFGIYTNMVFNLPFLPPKLSLGSIFNLSSAEFESSINRYEISDINIQAGLNFTYNVYDHNNIKSGITSGIFFGNYNLGFKQDLYNVFGIDPDNISLNYNLNLNSYIIPALFGVTFRPTNFIKVTLSTGGKFYYQIINDSLKADSNDNNSVVDGYLTRVLNDLKQDIKYDNPDLFTRLTTATFSISFKNVGIDLNLNFFPDKRHININANYVIKI